MMRSTKINSMVGMLLVLAVSGLAVAGENKLTAREAVSAADASNEQAEVSTTRSPAQTSTNTSETSNTTESKEMEAALKSRAERNAERMSAIR